MPDKSIGRFAIVKLWPDIKTAEDECIARIKIAAQVLGIECIEVKANGLLISDSSVHVSKANVDFVIHLHYDTPKLYDAFSFVALWNPIHFYHEWGYERTSRNLTTHDDFLSCSSDAADDHVARMVRMSSTHLPANFHLYHSTADVMYPPSLGDCKLFYAGINWEAISGGRSRHQDVLKRLDKTDFLRIYGPTIFQGVRVWANYKSYVCEVPFDGISLIKEISKAGISLVLSSQAHKDSELMSSRLFESVSAGALVICDENLFAKKFFGNSLLYIDSRSPSEQIYTDITRHLEWIHTHPDEAIAMITKAQEIFLQKFTLTRNLADLYDGLAERMLKLSAQQNPPENPAPKVLIYFLMTNYDESVLKAHIQNINVQDYADFYPVLVVDSLVSNLYRPKIEELLATSSFTIELVELNYFSYGIHPKIKANRPLGSVLSQLLSATEGFDAVMFVAPNEKIFSNHISVLAGALQRKPDVHCASTAAILINGDAPVHHVHETLDFGHVNPVGPTGYGRFIFRVSAIPEDINIALQYLHGRPLAVLVGNNNIDQQLPATIIIYLDTIFPDRPYKDAHENQIINAYCSQVFRIAIGQDKYANPLVKTESVSRIPKFNLKAIYRRWISTQIRAVLEQGLLARLKALKRKLGL